MTVDELLNSESYVDADIYAVRRLIELAQKYNITAEVRMVVGRLCFRDLSHECLVHDAQVNDVGVDSVLVIDQAYEPATLTTRLFFKLFSNPTQETDDVADGDDVAEPHCKYSLLHMDKNPSFILKDGTDLYSVATRSIPVGYIDFKKLDAYLAKFMRRMDDLEQKWCVACIQNSCAVMTKELAAE